MRTIWNGTLELDEIAIPVGLVPVVRDGGESFRRLHAACNTPIGLRSYCDQEKKLLEADEIVDGWEAAPGEFLVLAPDARAALKPAETRRIPIGGFTAAEAVKAELVARRYHLVPSSSVGTRAYFLFVAAIAELDVAALVRFAWRGEKIGAVTSHAGVLQLATLHFAEDAVELDSDVRAIADSCQIDGSLLDLVRELIDRHTRPLQPDDLASYERPRVRGLLEQLLAGEPIVHADAPVQQDEQPAAGADLEGALRRSLKQAPRRRRRAPAAAR